MANPNIQTALAHHQSGRLAEAEKIYRQILARDPNDPDALHLLGALAGQCGQTDAAIDLIRRAVSVRPNYVEALRNLGAMLAQTSRFEESIAIYREILALAPDDAAVHNDLGSVLLRENQVDEAIALLSKATALDPGFADAFRNLSYANRKKGFIEEALAASSRAVQLKPDWPDAIFEHAQALYTAGRAEQALAGFRRVLQINPKFTGAYNNIGKILVEMGKLDEAITTYAAGIETDPNDAQLHFNMGNTLRQADRLVAAAAGFTAAAQAKPDYLEAHANLAKVLAKLQRFDEALAAHANAAALDPNAAVTHEAMGDITLLKLDAKGAAEHFRRASAINPKSAESHIGLGIALQSQGLFEEAQAAFNRAVVLEPGQQTTDQRLLRGGKRQADEAEVQRLSKILQQTDLHPGFRSAVEFSLGSVLDEMDRFDEAFAHYFQANTLVKQFRALANEGYDPREHERWVDQIIKIHTPEFFEQRKGWGHPCELPVFIVGMPRSGTTLLHQIAASHPDVHGVGESSDMQQIATALGETDSTTEALGWQRDSVANAAQQQIQHYRSLNGKALRFVDKMPGNVNLLGLISLLFPAARVILCRRDPRDNCLSCYFQNFSTGNAFSYDLADCGHRSVQANRLMDHWLKVLPLRMIEVHYEEVVADLEGQARRLIDFLGLPWNPACLKFQEAKAPVLTASVWQVRQPIYNSSVGRWRNYQRHLGPLFEALGEIPGS